MNLFCSGLWIVKLQSFPELLLVFCGVGVENKTALQREPLPLCTSSNLLWVESNELVFKVVSEISAQLQHTVLSRSNLYILTLTGKVTRRSLVNS